MVGLCMCVFHLFSKNTRSMQILNIPAKSFSHQPAGVKAILFKNLLLQRYSNSKSSSRLAILKFCLFLLTTAKRSTV